MYSDARSLDWIKIRDGVLFRDNYQCVKCGNRISQFFLPINFPFIPKADPVPLM